MSPHSPMSFFNGWDVVSLYDTDLSNVDYVVRTLGGPVHVERIIYASDRPPGGLRQFVDALRARPEKINILVILRCTEAIIRTALHGTSPIKLTGVRAFKDYVAQKSEQWENREARKRTAQQAGLRETDDASPAKRAAGTTVSAASNLELSSSALAGQRRVCGADRPLHPSLGTDQCVSRSYAYWIRRERARWTFAGEPPRRPRCSLSSGPLGSP